MSRQESFGNGITSTLLSQLISHLLVSSKYRNFLQRCVCHGNAVCFHLIRISLTLASTFFPRSTTFSKWNITLEDVIFSVLYIMRSFYTCTLSLTNEATSSQKKHTRHTLLLCVFDGVPLFVGKFFWNLK